MKVFSYELIDGHIVFEIDGKRVLLDTGAPTSFGKIDRFSFLGLTFKLSPSYLGVNLDALSRNVGSNIHIVMGSDIIGCFDCLIDPGSLQLSFGSNLSDLEIGVPLSEVMHVPIILCRIAGKDLRLFLDTGAKLSYLHSDMVTEYEKQGEEQDFYPGIGEFETNVYRVPVRIAEEQVSLRMGILPPLLEMTLMAADVAGIVGTAILESFKICLSIPRQKVSLTRT